MNLFKHRQVKLINALIRHIKAKQNLENSSYFQVDGCIIGNGSQDFTKSHTSYGLNINGEKAQLIDIPGIEGNEEKFIDIIKNALKKAHLVCYVAKEAKGIEETTLQKIKNYMQKNVTEMVGIHNIPLQPQKEYDGDDYVEDITKKFNEANKKNSNIGEKLQSVVPEDMYKDTVGISALPGICALAIHNGKTSFAAPEKFPNNTAVAESLKSLRREQRTFLSRASDVDLLKVSHLNKLRNVIIDSCNNAPERIKKASLIRLSKLLQDDYLADITKQKTAIGEFRNKIQKRTNSLRDNIGNARDQLKRNMEHSVKNTVYDFFYQDILEKIIYPHIERHVKIDEDILNRELKSEQSRLNKKMSDDIQNAITSSSKDFAERIQNYVSDYQRGMMLDFQNISLELPEFNAESFDFKQLGSAAMTIGSYAISGFAIGNVFPGIGTLVGTIVGAFVGLVVWVAGWFTSKETKIRKAKSNARDKIEECAYETWNKMSGKIRDIANKLASKTDEVITLAYRQVESANQSYNLISDLESKIKKQVKHLDAEIELMRV
ncbi:YtxH domain-containing protein [uncultured Fibrobacter sp.]|uniref:YtxH domain-containing protein n=1 Tax=uncultured Fibrobacter sp. TaxID=261512 RepID=UPI0025CD4670|nr:YtxH domain-containing protein [uncultured Fibrobacter sp.]